MKVIIDTSKTKTPINPGQARSRPSKILSTKGRLSPCTPGHIGRLVLFLSPVRDFGLQWKVCPLASASSAPLPQNFLVDNLFIESRGTERIHNSTSPRYTHTPAPCF